MVRIGIIAVVAGIIISIGIALYYYDQYQPNFVFAEAGEPIQVGPVKYIVEYDGTHEGDEDTIPEHIFVKIRIAATNLSSEETRISGGQFYIVDENNDKTQPVYGDFSDQDLLDYYLQPNKETTFTTQFDVPFDEGKQYKIGIQPTKVQSSLDIGIICLLNC
ncbi:MAG: DUF4352 domain-containing protein [Nitrosopumilaceae archaeon]|nr:DUF4352 domain-containing protein [Nitrosopumilaceae archaeon]